MNATVTLEITYAGIDGAPSEDEIAAFVRFSCGEYGSCATTVCDAMEAANRTVSVNRVCASRK